jgi:hypothetical protein
MLKIDGNNNSNTQAHDNHGFQKQFYSDEHKQGGNYESANAQDYNQDYLYQVNSGQNYRDLN